MTLCSSCVLAAVVPKADPASALSVIQLLAGRCGLAVGDVLRALPSARDPSEVLEGVLASFGPQLLEVTPSRDQVAGAIGCIQSLIACYRVDLVRLLDAYDKAEVLRLLKALNVGIGDVVATLKPELRDIAP